MKINLSKTQLKFENTHFFLFLFPWIVNVNWNFSANFRSTRFFWHCRNILFLCENINLCGGICCEFSCIRQYKRDYLTLPRKFVTSGWIRLQFTTRPGYDIEVVKSLVKKSRPLSISRFHSVSFLLLLIFFFPQFWWNVEKPRNGKSISLRDRSTSFCFFNSCSWHVQVGK